MFRSLRTLHPASILRLMNNSSDDAHFAAAGMSICALPSMGASSINCITCNECFLRWQPKECVI